MLDEPTSGLDAVTESQLTETLDELTRGKTTLIITHRFSTIERAGQVLVLENGRIVQRGTHAELMAQGGICRQPSTTRNRPGARTRSSEREPAG